MRLNLFLKCDEETCHCNNRDNFYIEEHEVGVEILTARGDIGTFYIIGLLDKQWSRLSFKKCPTGQKTKWLYFILEQVIQKHGSFGKRKFSPNLYIVKTTTAKLLYVDLTLPVCSEPMYSNGAFL
jgi:hypothetical protein